MPRAYMFRESGPCTGSRRHCDGGADSRRVNARSRGEGQLGCCSTNVPLRVRAAPRRLRAPRLGGSAAPARQCARRFPPRRLRVGPRAGAAPDQEGAADRGRGRELEASWERLLAAHVAWTHTVKSILQASSGRLLVASRYSQSLRGYPFCRPSLVQSGLVTVSSGLFLFGLLVSRRNFLLQFNPPEKFPLQTLLNRGLPPVLRFLLSLLFLSQACLNLLGRRT